MIKETPTSHQALHALPLAVSSVRLLLHSSVLRVMALFPSAAPGFGRLIVTESELPFDQDESLQEEAISVDARTPIGRGQRARPLLVSLQNGLGLAAANIANTPRAGHRFSNPNSDCSNGLSKGSIRWHSP